MENRKAKTYSCEINGVFTQVKAYFKMNAFIYFRSMRPDVKFHDVNTIESSNSHQQTIDRLYN